MKELVSLLLCNIVVIPFKFFCLRRTEGIAHSSNTSDVDLTGASSANETTSASISRHCG